MGKTISQKKRKAHGRNARRATGPRTPAGKQKAAHRALRGLHPARVAPQ